ncbi:NUDIX domain-containing protein [Colletotrichum tofieldiae]|nr:NUDIX domain-containing protein [Colletotrichum tofieldiae]
MTTNQQPTQKPPPPAFNLTYPPSLESYNLPMRAWLTTKSKSWDGLATSALVFDRRNRHAPALGDPGGAVDDEDASVLVACARELWEEAGLEAVQIVRVVSEGKGKEPGSEFTNRTGTVVFRRFAFEVKVQQAEGDELEVRTDPEEHADHVWASEEEVLRERVGEKDIPITNAQMASLILDGFRRRREEAVEGGRNVVEG